MKYLRLGLRPPDLVVHPIDRVVADVDGVTRESILHADARPGEVTLLYRLSGNPDALRSALSEESDVRDVDVVDDHSGFTLFVRVAATVDDSVLLDLVHEHALIADTPIELTEGGLEVTLVGTDDHLREAMTDVPGEITVTVLEAGPYTPSHRGLLEPLTERQLEVFRTAVDRGYYDLPRRTTHEDLAGELDCAPSTVDEHLRKAEARVVSRLVD